jgi:hypothetical protein
LLPPGDGGSEDRRGQKELIAFLHDGYREPKESWAELLGDLEKRGMRAPVLAIGDAALGFPGERRGMPSPRPATDETGCA